MACSEPDAWPLHFKRVMNSARVMFKPNTYPAKSALATIMLPQPVVDKFQTQLLSLHAAAQGKLMNEWLPIPRFESVANDNYLPAIKFLEVSPNNVREIAC